MPVLSFQLSANKPQLPGKLKHGPNCPMSAKMPRTATNNDCTNAMPIDDNTGNPSLYDQRYYALVQGLGDIVSRYKPDGTLLYVSGNYCLIFERSKDELLGRTIFEFLDPTMHEGSKLRLSKISVQSPSIEGQNIIYQKRGGGRRVNWVTSGIFDDDGSVIEYQSIGRDVTDIIETREQLALSELRHRQAVDIAGLGYWIWDETKDCLSYLSEATAAIYGVSVELALNRSTTVQNNVQVVHPDDQERYYDILNEAAENLSPYDVTFRIVRPDGELRYLRELAEPHLDADGKLFQTIGTTQDVTERELDAQKIAHMANHDALTGLPNRSLFTDRLETSIKNAKRDQKPLAILFIDLDGFKPVNDTHGHQAGDDILVEVSRRLTTCVRASDTVGRFGGDEFVALLGGDIDAERSGKIADKIIDHVSRPIDSSGLSLIVGASIGIAVYPNDGSTPEGLMAAADAAMYEAKRSGKGRYRQTS
jgi:diguanylate cyclase (GGDEF)-like protein/PAS domain S-box-containing protein